MGTFYERLAGLGKPKKVQSFAWKEARVNCDTCTAYGGSGWRVTKSPAHWILSFPLGFRPNAALQAAAAISRTSAAIRDIIRRESEISIIISSASEPSRGKQK